MHLDELSKQDVENYWLHLTGIPKQNLRKSTIKKNISARHNKHPYGVCYLTVTSTKAVQHIYGAIQNYAEIVNEKWITG